MHYERGKQAVHTAVGVSRGRDRKYSNRLNLHKRRSKSKLIVCLKILDDRSDHSCSLEGDVS